MSRAAIFDAITTDTALNALGITADSVYHNYSLEERPIAAGPFIIFRWGETDSAPVPGVKSPVRLTVWAHWPLEETNDFSRIDGILDACDSVMDSVTNKSGADGYTVTCVRLNGRSSDLKDDGFQTISRNAVYEVLSRKS